ncbi:hypothetical protein L3X38_043521 [Prunus dulcis]|uniref:Uncharacterized protein n=1 Tax=Prunus dulcis TaxID=3755 RepID=A0AAD4UWV7_PRUDU|nr:hypothetical protein L3X38_043521 [Prunus dulcis]
MPSVALGNQSPFQKLFDKPPPLQHLRVFGTAVYPYLRPFNEHKLQPRTVQCVFMAYSKGYKDSSLASSQSSAVPSHASASFGGDPVLVASSADSTENLQVLSAQQLQVILPPHDSSSASMSPYMHPVQTRSKSGIDNTKPFEDYYHCYLTTIPALYEAAEPATYKAASQ